ncbi:GNAT family N-acetyltransferase [Actibacterium sp. 188UL27-1]|uniref:GNAT family N-acetyltransferase n=1 Tax=Actibacterium sp. 188UL27-1 TaxID=2786961 RepID=UPI00195CAE08|nr:GNAT family N-acetyltransferase [Actibacterium sp. 188UL27-1]MBM7066671.1 GNAT family N-acetyltransferase [Actibacterium sp. 188UL27-1]
MTSTRLALTIRPSEPRDLAAVDALLARSYPTLLKADYPPSIMVTAVPLLSRAQPALITSGTYYVAETEQEEIVGAGGWTAKRRIRAAADIRHLVTDHRRVRQGIGRKLMTHVLAEAEVARIRRVDCWATRTAVPLYQSLGFVTLGPIEVPLSGGIRFPAVQMQFTL